MLFDSVIVFLLLWAAVTGWRNGFLKELVSSVGFLIGLVIAAICYSHFGEYLAIVGSETNLVLNIGAFFLLWIIVPIFLGFVANVMTKALKTVCLGWANSLAGSILAMAKYTLLLSCIVNVMSALHLLDAERKHNSRLLPIITKVTAVAVSQLKEKIDASFPAESDTLWIDMNKDTIR